MADMSSCLLYTASGRVASSPAASSRDAERASHHSGDAVRQFIPGLLALLALLTISGCGEADPVPTDGTRIRVVETYGAAAERSVTLTALFSSDVAGATEVSDVKIEVKPTGTPLVQKLETLLEDAGFRWRSGQKGWPELLRTLAPSPE